MSFKTLSYRVQKQKLSRIGALLLATAICGASAHAETLDARALYFSNSGISMATGNPAKPKPAAKAKTVEPQQYAGVRYTILQRLDNRWIPVRASKSFKSGDEIKIEVQANIDAQISVFNIGPTGDVSLLGTGRRLPGQNLNVPTTGVLKFEDPAGTEIVSILVSKNNIAPNILKEHLRSSIIECGYQVTRNIAVSAGQDNEFSLDSLKEKQCFSQSNSRNLVISDAGSDRVAVTRADDLVASDRYMTLKLAFKHE